MTVEYKQSEVREHAEAIAWHFIKHNNDNARVFIYEDGLHFDSNSPQFGSSAIIFNHAEECEIIFGREELVDVLDFLEVDIENLEDHEEEIVNGVEHRLEVLLENRNAQLIAE